MNEVSVDPNVWGPMCWDALFYIAFRVDLEAHWSEVHTLFHLLEVVLPCSHCRRHYALYKKQVSPVTAIKKSDPESAAKWLWIIHDMVNQNLGKICIDYEHLRKKHKSLTCLVSDFNVLDLFVFMTFASKKKDKTEQAIRIMSQLLQTIRPFRVCALLDVLTVDGLLETRRQLLEAYGYPPETADEARANYEHALFRL